MSQTLFHHTEAGRTTITTVVRLAERFVVAVERIATAMEPQQDLLLREPVVHEATPPHIYSVRMAIENGARSLRGAADLAGLTTAQMQLAWEFVTKDSHFCPGPRPSGSDCGLLVVAGKGRCVRCTAAAE